MLTVRSAVLAAVTTAAFLTLMGCNEDFGPPGPTRTESRSVDLDNSELVRAELKMGAGQLRVRGGSSKLMDAEFSYNRPAMRPNLHYDASGFRGHLLLEEPSGVHHMNSNYRWDLRFNDDKPLDLIVNFGAGEGRLDVGELRLRSLEIHMGVGELRVDLRGMPKNDYDVSIHGGVGEATIYLPEGVGVVADAHGGIGGINARGLQNRDGRYVNDAYGHAKTTVRLDVHGGIGSINLVGS
ncbi:MAG TPA: toast rack family protein [Bryobacteraceae bacterium]|nr:toast rack family protein [Bryobacteraceae bacterium]